MTGFLEHPASAGPVGAIMDEYARAAREFCDVVEPFDAARFEASEVSDDPDTTSIREVCRHAGRAAFGYAEDIARVLEKPLKRPLDPNEHIRQPQDVRPVLVAALRFTERVVEPLRSMKGPEVEALTFRVSWGTLYTPESLLEHAICHLLRHRRQLERWAAGS